MPRSMPNVSGLRDATRREARFVWSHRSAFAFTSMRPQWIARQVDNVMQPA
jgi:hypothetical protein